MLTIKDLKVGIKDNNVISNLAKKLKVDEKDILSYEIIRQSIDARDKSNILFVYEIDFSLKDETKLKNYKLVSNTIDREYHFPYSIKCKINKKVCVIGSGPAGLFTCFMLIQNGFDVCLYERGDKLEIRDKKVLEFWQDNILDLNTNVQFGEGGAGTYSDGKLNTMIKGNNYIRFVLKTFVKFGANKEIMYSFKPHVGTDELKKVIVNMRNYLLENGCKIFYNSCLTNLDIKNGNLKGFYINDSEYIESDMLVLSIGNSARDTFRMLYDNGINMVNKPFAVGLRVQHPQRLIDESQYGKENLQYLNKSSYKLTYTSLSGRGIYSFCMCPGGYVVNASSENGRLVVNGMSYSDRNSENGNSAIVVNVNEKDYGIDALAGIKYQESLEEKAYKLGKGFIPSQNLKDYINNTESQKLNIDCCFKGNYHFANLNILFSDDINKDIKEAFGYFDKKIKGFAMNDAILSGVESRTSCAVRIIRDENFETNIKGLYVCGEGSGYAGGITSSAIDGIKLSEMICKVFY